MYTSLSYSNYIANNHMKLNRNELLVMLAKLVHISKNEIKQIQLGDPQSKSQEENRGSINRMKGIIKDNVKDTIQYITKLNKNNLDKVAMIIDVVKLFGSKQHISIIPDELFNTFWTFAENKNYHISFDENYQFFSVID